MTKYKIGVVAPTVEIPHKEIDISRNNIIKFNDT
jgi:hypothetical protein